MMTGWGMGFGVLGFVLMIAFWIAIVAAAIWLLSHLFPASATPRAQGNAPEAALDILKQRYARGELTQEAFGAMRRDIEQ